MQNLVGPWRKKYLELNDRYQKALEGPDTYEDYFDFVEDDFDNIWNQLDETSGLIGLTLATAPRVDGVDFSQFKAFVRRVKRGKNRILDVEEDAKTASIEDLFLSREDFIASVSKATKIELIDELLESLKNALNEFDKELVVK